jgi:NitT/TauT family transport system ATP-binding protein
MILQLDQVSKVFTSPSGSVTHVLDRLSLEVGEREFVCVVGPSGCGKSTLLSLLGQLDEPDSGAVNFLGVKGSAGPNTTIVWQEYALIPWRTALENVAFGLELRGVSKRDRLIRARSYLDVMGMDGFEGHLPHQLSGGMRQRVGIARALANDPEVLLMDEPFAALDAQTRRVMQEELLRLWNREKKSVIFVTHHIDEALLLGDRVVVLSKRPAKVLEEIAIPFGRPRTVESIELDPRFGQLKTHIWHLLRTVTEDELRP